MRPLHPTSPSATAPWTPLSPLQPPAWFRSSPGPQPQGRGRGGPREPVWIPLAAVETQGGSGGPQELTKGQRKRLSLRVPGRVGGTECDPSTRAVLIGPQKGVTCPLSYSLPPGSLQLGAPPQMGCHREPLSLPRMCRHWSLKYLQESRDWGSSHSQPCQPSLAEVFGILALRLSSLTPDLRGTGAWGLGIWIWI